MQLYSKSKFSHVTSMVAKQANKSINGWLNNKGINEWLGK